MIRPRAARTRQAEAQAELWRFHVAAKGPADSGPSGTFEPLHDGDRQRGKSVAKARNPLQSGAFEVSLS